MITRAGNGVGRRGEEIGVVEDPWRQRLPPVSTLIPRLRRDFIHFRRYSFLPLCSLLLSDYWIAGLLAKLSSFRDYFILAKFFFLSVSFLFRI